MSVQPVAAPKVHDIIELHHLPLTIYTPENSYSSVSTLKLLPLLRRTTVYADTGLMNLIQTVGVRIP